MTQPPDVYVPSIPRPARWPRLWRIGRVSALLLAGGALFLAKMLAVGTLMSTPASRPGWFERAIRANPALIGAMLVVEILCFAAAWLDGYGAAGANPLLARARRLAYAGLAVAVVLSGLMVAASA
ncbi:MAG TPA: hypothetical protein VGE07_12325 [Herpetosiphonaceae bacterium]